MYGLESFIRTLGIPRPPMTSPDGTLWQYHPRRGHHSAVACWGVLLDILQESNILRDQFLANKVVFGLDVSLRDYTRDQPKKLDLVIGRPDPSGRVRKKPHTLPSLVDKWGIDLTPQAADAVQKLHYVEEGPIGAVHLAAEAKAAMTEFGKSRPRLYDELNSSHQIVHGASTHALAMGVAMINVAPEFLSPTNNPKGSSYFDATVVNAEQQPRQADLTVKHVAGLPRRGGPKATGYDSLAIVVVDMRNDGGPVRLVDQPPAPPADSVFRYSQAIRRIASEYDASFSKL